MTVIKQSIFSSLLMIYFGGCIEPNTEDLWSITIDSVLETSGYARDVSIDNDVVFVAAGEAGAEIWNIINTNDPSLLHSISLDEIGADKEISQIHYSPINNLLHLLEYNERSYVFLVNDSSYNVESPYGQYGAEDTRDFAIIDSLETFTYYSVIKKDHIIKWQRWEKTELGGLFYWGDAGLGDEVDVNAVPSSIALSNRAIVLGVGQLGIQIWKLVDLDGDPNFQTSIDLGGTVESVYLLDENSLFVARGTYGASYIPINQIEIDTSTNSVTNNIIITEFAEDLTVNHIAVSNGIATLSLGAKGIALYDVSEPSAPIEKGIFPVGYTYKSQFWGEKLVVCSREGLQIITIEQ